MILSGRRLDLIMSTDVSLKEGNNAFITNIDAFWPGNDPLNLVLFFATKGTIIAETLFLSLSHCSTFPSLLAYMF
jgi:hypothetical protein